MNRTPVSSSMIASIGYDKNTRTLEVEFTGKGNPVWQYKGVSPEAYDSLINADSIGKHFLANVRGQYEEEKQ